MTPLRGKGALARVVLLLLVTESSGCTLAGASIGAAASPSRAEERFSRFEVGSVGVGRSVEVRMRWGETVRGTYAGSGRDWRGSPIPDTIAIDRSGRARNMRTDDIESITIPGRPSGATTGALIGLLLDAVVLGAIVSGMAKKIEERSLEEDSNAR